VQLLSFSPHRFYGPKGIGVLYRNRKARVTSHIHGGVQEGGRRAGTENVPASSARASRRRLRRARDGPARRACGDAAKAALRRPLEKHQVHQAQRPVPGPLRICNTLNLSTEFIEGEGQLLLLDYQGIAVASGSSCVSKSLKVSHVLSAIQLDHALAQGNIIMSLGKDNTVEDVDYVIETFPEDRRQAPQHVADVEGIRGRRHRLGHRPTGRGKSFTQHAADISGKPAH
jgi:cysteine desulfurase